MAVLTGGFTGVRDWLVYGLAGVREPEELGNRNMVGRSDTADRDREFFALCCGSREELESFARHLGGQVSPCGVCLAGERRGPGGPARGGGRYGPVRDYLAGVEGCQVQMTFTEVEGLVGRLPDSARLHRAWWASGSNVEARAWLDAGWQVASVDHLYIDPRRCRPDGPGSGPRPGSREVGPPH